MKKVFTILMTVIMCVSLVACASNKPVEEVKEPETVTEQVTEAVEEAVEEIPEEVVKTPVIMYDADAVDETLRNTGMFTEVARNYGTDFDGTYYKSINEPEAYVANEYTHKEVYSGAKGGRDVHFVFAHYLEMYFTGEGFEGLNSEFTCALSDVEVTIRAFEDKTKIVLSRSDVGSSTIILDADKHIVSVNSKDWMLENNNENLTYIYDSVDSVIGMFGLSMNDIIDLNSLTTALSE